MAPTTIKTIKVLMMEENMRFIPIDSKKLQKGVIKKANKIPKVNGTKKGAPKYKMAKTNRIKISILLIFVILCMRPINFYPPKIIKTQRTSLLLLH